MRPYLPSITFGLALLAGASVAHAQSLVTTPYQILVIQPNGTTLHGPVPLVAVSAGTIQPLQTVQTIQIAQVARPPVRHHIAANHRTTSRTLYNFVPPAAAVPTVVTPVVVTQAPALAPGQMLNLSGQFQCVEGCPGGQAGVAVVTQSGWDLNLVNELGQPTRAWVDWPGHIWAQSWNEGAVYSPDGMTIQFDNGTVWRRNIELLVMPSMPAR